MRRLLRWIGVTAAGLLAAALVFTFWYQPQREVRGTWLSEGYGLAFDIGRLTTDVHEVSELHCLRNMRIPSNTWLLDRAAGYRFTAQGDRLTVDVDGVLNPIIATRAPLPASCAASPDASPDAAYAIFHNAFARHYPFFDLYGVDWDSRSDPGPLAGPADLDRALRDAVADLPDGHVYLMTDSGLHAARPDPDWITEVPDFATASEALLTDLGRIPEAAITYGWLPGEIAYIRLDNIEPPRPFGGTVRRQAAEILAALAALYGEAQGLVLDLRWNTGGADSAALGYASLFADDAWSAGTKVTQIAPGRFTDPVQIEPQPLGPAQFDVPVIVLTSELTISAAEVLALALRELPDVTLMGTETAGAFSDMMFRRLPNGWAFSLSHQVYRDPDGVSYEATGLPPDIRRDLDLAGFRAGRDTLLAEAAAALAAGATPSE